MTTDETDKLIRDFDKLRENKAYHELGWLFWNSMGEMLFWEDEEKAKKTKELWNSLSDSEKSLCESSA
jgi:hypothetical protein